MTREAVRIAIPIVLLALSCKGTSGGGGSPIEPPPAPTIASVEPANAAPGEVVTIHGDHLAGILPIVSFYGLAGRVISATDAEIEVVVPEIAEGDRWIVVSVDGNASLPFPYRIAPAAAPTITSIQPAQARSGETIVIAGTHLSGASPVLVEIAGIRAGVQTAGPARIVAVIPAVAVGVTNVRVTVGPRVSNVFPLEVLRASPTILAVVPNPTRAGLWVTIRGSYNLAGSDVTVLVDGRSAEVRLPSDMFELGARIPAIDTGAHSLQVGVGGELSAPFEFSVDDFDVSGVYDVQGVIVELHVGLRGCSDLLPERGSRRDTQLELFDSRPDLVARLGSDPREYQGTVDWNGWLAGPPVSFLGPARGINGRVTPRPGDGRLEIDATIVHVIDLLCGYSEHVTGAKRQTPSP